MKALSLSIALGLACSLFPVDVLSQQRDTLEIRVMVDQAPAQLTALFERVRSEIVAVVGGQATIGLSQNDIRANGFDPARAEEIYQEMAAGAADLIIAFGAVSASVLSARETYPKPTILFGGVHRELLDLPPPGATSGIPNFTYLISARSYERDLRALKSLYDFRRVGIVMPTGLIETLGLDLRLQELMAEIDSEFEVVGYASPADVEEALDRIDALYLLESLFIPDEEIRTVAELLIDRDIPSFSDTRRQDVEMGLLATNQPREGLDPFFRRLAILVESVVNGEELADQPVHFDLDQPLTVNFHTARAIGVPIRYSLITTTEFVGGFENPLAERRYTLLDLIEEALAASLGLEVARQDVRIAEQDHRSSWSNYLPSLSVGVTQTVLDQDLATVSGGRNPQYATQGGVSLNQVAFSPDVNAGMSIRRSLLDARREGLRASEWDVVLDAASAYFTALILKANVEIQAQNLDATKQNLRIAVQSFDAGQTGRGDVLRLESKAAQDMQALVDAVIALDQGHHAINQLVNQPVSREIDVLDVTMRSGTFTDVDFEEIRLILDDPTLREPFEDWLALEAVANAPELRFFDHNIDAVGRSARLNGLERFLPTIAAGLDLSRTFTQRGAGVPPAGVFIDEYYSLGVSASIPLFDSNQRRIARQTNLIQQDQLRVDRRSTEIAIERAVRDIVLDLTGGIAGIQLSLSSEEAAGESLELAQSAYASGANTVVELLDAQTNYLGAQLARASATYSFLATAVGLQRLVGHFTMLSSPELNDAYMRRFQTFLQTREGGRP